MVKDERSEKDVMATTARDRLLEAAERRFEAHGIAATGVNDLIADARVARMSLYNHFASKDDLVAAYLERRDADWRARVEARVATIGDPVERLLAVIREYGARVATTGFRGCAFVNAAAELPPGHPGWPVIHRHKQGVRALLRSLADQAAAEDPEALAEELFLVAEGAIVDAGVRRSDAPFAVAERTAARLIAGHRAGVRPS